MGISPPFALGTFLYKTTHRLQFRHCEGIRKQGFQHNQNSMLRFFDTSHNNIVMHKTKVSLVPGCIPLG